MKILIADDDFSTRCLLQRMLNQYGICDMAVNGWEVIQAYKLAWQEIAPYNLILLDSLMPEMDGAEVIQEIRQLEKNYGVQESESVKIVIISFIGGESNIKQLVEDQWVAFLAKPLDKKKLVQTLIDLRLDDVKVIC